MKNKFRKTNLESILSQLGTDGSIEEAMKNILESLKGGAKKMFFDNLSPMGREAFKLGFQVIENEHYILTEHEYAEIRENWFTHFIKTHDEIVEILSDGGDEIFKYAIGEYGYDYVNDVYRQDSRSLEQIMEFVTKEHARAIKLQSEHKGKLQDKLKTQLSDVVATLNELTSNDTDVVKHFEIGIEGAQFSITMGKIKECDCDTSTDTSTDGFEKFSEQLDKIFNDAFKNM